MEARAIVSVIDDLTSTSTTDALSANMGRELNDAKQDKLYDSGWNDLSLANGAVAYSTPQKPQYRKIGSQVFLRGVFKGVTAMPITIATLPEGYRPSMKLIYAQSCTGARVDRMEIETTGEVKLSAINEGTTINDTWHSIATSFLVD